MLRNDAQDTYQLALRVGGEYLEGELRASSEPVYTYKIIERGPDCAE